MSVSSTPTTASPEPAPTPEPVPEDAAAAADEGQPVEADGRRVRRREPGELLIEHRANVVEDDGIVGQELGHIAQVDLVHRLGDELERERIAGVAAHQFGVLFRRIGQTAVGQELIAGSGVEPGQAQRAHLGEIFLQTGVTRRALPAGEQQRAGVVV